VEWSGEDPMSGRALIVSGRGNLLQDSRAVADLERARRLFDDLEKTRDLIQVLDLAKAGEAVRVFIGSENSLFSLSGSSLIVSPYMNAERKVVGALGVIGPTRLNYARVIPVVDYTARAVGRVLDSRGSDR
jgi:heat-inducible transcriptional repressor